MAIAIGILVCLLPALYVLSIGPALWLNRIGVLRPKTVDVVYQPIYTAARANRHIAGSLNWYQSLWIGNGHPGGPILP